MFEQAFKNIDDVLWKDAGCTSELDYTEQTSWLLFLKYLDALEHDKVMEAQLEGKQYSHILEKPYRWESWAAPKGKDGKLDHAPCNGRARLPRQTDSPPQSMSPNYCRSPWSGNNWYPTCTLDNPVSRSSYCCPSGWRRPTGSCRGNRCANWELDRSPRC